MIRLTNNQAQALLSKAAVNLFADSTRPFPTKDIFNILDLVEMVEKRNRTYLKQYRKIIEDNKGVIGDDQKIKYASDEDKNKAIEQLIELNEAKLEYQFEPLDIKDDWPRLSLAEASILKPLIRNGKNEGHSE